MLQDISPSRLDNSFKNLNITDIDQVMIFDNEGKLLCRAKDGVLEFIMCSDLFDAGLYTKEQIPALQSGSITGNHPGNDEISGINSLKAFIYLFSIDEKKYFLLLNTPADIQNRFTKKGYDFHTIREIRDLSEGRELFAAFTSFHLWKWYSDNRFCGKCGEGLKPDEKERALRCEKCGNIIYPRINPAVIVGIINKDRLLITRYARGYAHNALVAGFTEIGETLEQTVMREAMEETGLKVKNIRYYKSQPWGMAMDILAGFFCDVDGSDTIHMDKEELKTAEWVKRDEIVPQPGNISLTNEMIKLFMSGNEPPYHPLSS